MEVEFPQSAREAEDHVRSIRRDKGLGDGPEQIGNNAADLESALQVLSNDLYQTATHFLLELIQNADDNEYSAEVPTLSISYYKGRVRIDCNERGFTKKNVEAICRICQSTKSGRSKSAGFVGEKGIGFKAVFKVASQVWISSGHYSFRFDRDAHLGMIAPIWDRFPEAPKAGCTSFLMELAKDCDEDQIIKELRSHDERTLIFLRRLRRLEINVNPGTFSVQKPFQAVLGRQGETSKKDSTMVLMRNGVKKHYFVWRHVASKLPAEPRRPGIHSSEVVLAFPHTGVNGARPVCPIIESQNVYAFLPIRDVGFPFLLQADFLLSANREDVHLDPAWNKTLASAAAVAYVDAIQHVGSLSNDLRYSWIKYIPVAEAKTPFFEELRVSINKKLQNSKVLESHAGSMKKPANLINVPRHLCDLSGRPFVMRDGGNGRFLAAGYDGVKDSGGILAKHLRVGTMEGRLFYTEMAAAIKPGPEKFFASKSREWHSAFARALLTTTRPLGVLDLPVIPLQSGKWISWGYGIFFPDSAAASAIPEGISIPLVDRDAAADPDRRKLLEQKGVANLTDFDIGIAIERTHKSTDFRPDDLRPDVLISHAAFMFRARLGDEDLISIWMAADVGPCRLSHAMYRPSDVSGAASGLLPHVEGSSYGFLHRGYTELDVPDRSSWFDCLRDHFQVGLYPRFFQPRDTTDGPAELNIHADFKLVMRDLPPNTWLTVLRDGWSFYAKWLDPAPQSDEEFELDKLREYLSSRQVACTGTMESEQLRHTYMPLDPLMGGYGDLAAFLDVPDPLDPRWRRLLKGFHVGIEADVGFYLSCLKGVKINTKVPVDTARNIMNKIEDHLDVMNDSLTLARETVAREKLIHVPPTGENKDGERGTWVSQSECFWRGDPWLTQSAGLERWYPDLEVLFRTHLLVPNAGIDHYIREGRAVPQLPSPILPRIERVFVALTTQIKADGLDARQKEEIRGLCIVPVTPAGGDAWWLTSFSSQKKPWLIADRENLRTQFRSVMPLLAFDAAFVLKIRSLLKALDLRDRFLSELVTSVTEAYGDVEFHRELTKKYRKRSKYLFRLIPEDQTDEVHLREKFSTVDVYVAPKIVQYWHAPLALGRVTSTNAEGVAFLESDRSGALHIYLRDGYEKDEYPYELAEQLRAFFNISVEDRDLLAAAITAPEERVEQLFEARGIAPLLEETSDNEEDGERHAAYAPVQFPPGPIKASRKRLGGSSRLSRLLSSTRFGPSFFSRGDGDSGSLPPYDVAVERSARSAIGRPVEPRAFSSSFTLATLSSELSKLEFVQQQDAVVGRPTITPSVFDRFRSWTQRDSDAGEMMVSDILNAVLGRQYDKATMWKSRRERKDHDSAGFTFSDTQGRFSAFLMRLDGLPGKAQGYSRLVYHLDVKATDSEFFDITQAELERARKYSVHSQPNPAREAPSKNVSVLVHISDLRTEPRIRFLTDPWDLFDDGQLDIKSTTTYRARLNLRDRRPVAGQLGGEAGFDAIQIRERGGGEEDEPVPKYDKGKTVGENPKAV